MNWFIAGILIDKVIDSDQIVNQLFPNIWVFIAHIIATVVLLIIIRFFFFFSFKQMMRKRRQVIREIIDDAVQKQTQAAKNETKANLFLKASKIEAQELLDGVKQQAMQEREEIIHQATQEAQFITRQTHNDLAKERIKAEESIREEIINVGLRLAEKVLEKEIDAKQNQKLIDDFINELE